MHGGAQEGHQAEHMDNPKSFNPDAATHVERHGDQQGQVKGDPADPYP